MALVCAEWSVHICIQVVITNGVSGGIDCLMHLICDPGGGCDLFAYLFIYLFLTRPDPHEFVLECVTWRL